MPNTKINSFTIAHYILLFFVVVFCIGIVAWILIHKPNNTHVAADMNQTVIADN